MSTVACYQPSTSLPPPGGWLRASLPPPGDGCGRLSPLRALAAGVSPPCGGSTRRSGGEGGGRHHPPKIFVALSICPANRSTTPATILIDASASPQLRCSTASRTAGIVFTP